MTTSHSVVVALVALACMTDIRTRRIPNVLTFGATIAALVFHGSTAGTSGLATSVGGWMVGAALFLPVFALRGMGAGDVKLLAAVGAWLGPLPVAWVALVTAIAGGAVGLVVALLHGYLRTALRNVWMLLNHWRMSGIQPLPAVTLESGRGPRLAYAVPIAIGTVTTLWLKY
ncbi:MAG: A24 family peptidase [Vicinamibacterales bacterium]